MDLAEQDLHIPQLMHPEDLAVDKPDKLSTMTYLSQFCFPNSVGEKTLLDFINKKLPKHNITNFTTDWVDGRVLGALTAVICPYDPMTHDANPTERCKGAMAAAEVDLFVRKILDTSEFINHELDPCLRMAYLTDMYHATQPPRILETYIPERIGPGQEIVVDLEVPPNGRIEGMAFGTNTGSTTVTIEATSANRSQVKIAIPVRDNYTVSITQRGKVIRGCPFIVSLDTYSVPCVNTDMPHKVGDPCCLTFDTSQIDAAKSVEVKVTGETAGNIEHKMEKLSSERSILSFYPPSLDTYTITVDVAGKPVKESPFVVSLVHIADPKKVVCGEVESSGVDSPVSIAINCKNAGKGTLTASCMGKTSGDIHVHIVTTDATPSAVTFTPTSEDLYLLQVLYEGGEVPGPPWCIDFRHLPPQPSKVKVVGNPTGLMEVGKMLNVVFDTSDAGTGQLTASCNGTTCGDVPVSVVTIGLGKFQVGFVPTVPDNYFVMVYWAGEQVPGAPFQISFGCKPVDASKCRLVGLTGNPALVKVRKVNQGLIGQEIILQVKTAGAGEGKLEVKVQTPSNEAVIVPWQNPDNPDTQTVRYTPLIQGHYCIQFLWGGSAIPGSPIKFDAVSPLVFPIGGPITVQLELDGKKKDLNGEAVLQREGLPEKFRANVDKSSNENVVLSLDPSAVEPGTYLLYVYSKYRELPNSPILLVYGNEEADGNTPTTETDSSPTAVELGGRNKPAESETVLDERVTEVVEAESNPVVDERVKETDEKSEAVTDEMVAEVAESGAGDKVTGVAEEAVVVSSSLLESKPPALKVSNPPGDNVTESLTLLETLAPLGSDISAESTIPRDRSYTSTDTLQDGNLSLDINAITRSHSVGERPEVMRTTTPISGLGQKEEKLSPGDQRIEEAFATHSDIGDQSRHSLLQTSTPPNNPLTLSLVEEAAAAPLHEGHAHPNAERVVDKLGLSDSGATEMLEQQKEKEQNDKEKKGKKKSKEQKKKEKEKQKAEKVEKAKREKEEKKRKKGRKKEGGLNLEDQEFRVGIKMKYKLHCEDLGSKPPVITCNPPEAAKHAIVPASQFGKNTYWCELTPSRVGEMEVSIIYENFHILGSPFLVDVGPRGDASQCTMVETSSTCQQQLEDSLLFCIAVPESAGKGRLTASVRSAGTNKRNSGLLTTAITMHHYHVEFKPNEGLEYLLSVKYDERHIKGSPFIINLGDPTKCKVHGDGFKQAQMDEENTFLIDATDAGPGELSVKIGSEGKTIEPKITVTGDKEYRVSYTIKTPGWYHVAVLWGEGHVKNSPFTVPCIAASQFSVADDSIHKSYAGGITSIRVITTVPNIRHKLLSVFAHPKTDVSKMFSGEIVQTREGVFTCSLHPTEVHIGMCNVHICWNGKEIKGSPYHITIHEPPSPGDFSLEASEENPGDIAVHVNGPTDVFASDSVVATVDNLFTNERVEAKVTKLSNEKCSIQLLPTMGGEYQLSILYAGNHIANSPFVLTQADPSQCHISGEGLRVSKVDELSKFMVDHSKAGLGHLKVEIEGEDGSTIEPFIASGETLSEVNYISKHLGGYRIIVQWGEHELPSSPFMMYTVDPSKFSLIRPLPKQTAVGQTIHFTIQASRPAEEWEHLSVTAKLIHQQKVYRGTVDAEKNYEEQRYHCALDIPDEGHYAIYVQCRGLDIQGSPIKIRMMPSPKPDKVCVSGAGLRGGTIDQRRQFTIDTREAGHGHVSLKVKGPSGGFSIDMHHHETSERIIIAEYTPVYAGKYTIHVMWAGLAVPGSPFTVSILSRRKGEMKDNQDGELVSIIGNKVYMTYVQLKVHARFI